MSGPTFSTQCEPTGFRRITFGLDRPDVLSTYLVAVESDKTEAATLLSNGNLVSEGEGSIPGDWMSKVNELGVSTESTSRASSSSSSSRHFVVYEDPYPKPSYLFALVAGNFEVLSEVFKTQSGREVKLRLFAEKKSTNSTRIPQLGWAMKALKRSMRWDEEVFGLEYDLSEFNIVGIDSFNQGAMENKGLNIFNTAYLLASPSSSTDADYEWIMGVVAHEYFHNWTGNRVTLRDWFQLTLKEGLTVYRDQRFSGDVSQSVVKRIQDVANLRSVQFVEDGGPMRHPIRPDSYIAINNFYTSTVYSKGAEVIRMYESLLGKDGFRRGLDLYFDRHDGKAVTCDDFLNAMGDANSINLTQFGRWYSHSGTPQVEIQECKWDQRSETVTITMEQHHPSHKNSSSPIEPFMIPIRVGLISKSTGTDLIDNEAHKDSTQTLVLSETKQTFTIPNVKEDCVLSVNRGFSAPITLTWSVPHAAPLTSPGRPLSELTTLACSDSDAFSRYDASVHLLTRLIHHTLMGVDRPEKIKTVGERGEESEESHISRELMSGVMRREEVEAMVAATFAEILDGDSNVAAFALRPPSVTEVQQDIMSSTSTSHLRESEKTVILDQCRDPVAVHGAIRRTKAGIGRALYPQLVQLYDHLTQQSFNAKEGFDDEDSDQGLLLTPAAISTRRLRNTLIDLLSCAAVRSVSEGMCDQHHQRSSECEGSAKVGCSPHSHGAKKGESKVEKEALERAKRHVESARCASDRLAGVNAVLYFEQSENETHKVIQDLYDDAQGDENKLNKWFAIQAGASHREDTYERVMALTQHPEFKNNINNPNRLRSLISSFIGNVPHFHRSDGLGYRLVTDMIIAVDKINPLTAAGMARGFSRVTRADPSRRAKLRELISEIMGVEGEVKSVSDDVYEVLSKVMKEL
eukprot:GHVN01104050.1.p1 GENE.GHVN01104050.1~~GHVN01104050.1.p1  ORF type:complete len:916 (-),score=235.78 GHVN01104050.1:103-2850(-)